jgi:hypothetical protein
LNRRRFKSFETRGEVFAAVAHLAEDASAGDGGLDLGARADDARIREQAIEVARCESSDEVRIEAGERLAECFALPEHDGPRRAGLKALQHQHFPQRTGVTVRHAPFLVVIGPPQRVAAGPGAPGRCSISSCCSFVGPVTANSLDGSSAGSSGAARRLGGGSLPDPGASRGAAGTHRIIVIPSAGVQLQRRLRPHRALLRPNVRTVRHVAV